MTTMMTALFLTVMGTTTMLSSRVNAQYHSSSIYQTTSGLGFEILVVNDDDDNNDNINNGDLASTPNDDENDVRKLLFPTQHVYKIEQSMSKYFRSLLINDESSLRFIDQPQTDIVDVTVNIQKQTATTTSSSGGIIEFDAEVSLLHVDDVGSDGVTDLAALLTFLVDRNTTGASYAYLDNQIRSNTSTVSKITSMSFIYTGSSDVVNDLAVPQRVLDRYVASVGRSESEKTLIIVVTFLSMALLVVSAVLCWITGTWFELRKQLQILMQREEEMARMSMQQNNLKTKPTDETEKHNENNDDGSPARDSHLTEPSGFLGANNPYHVSSQALNGLEIKMTPLRDRRSSSGDDGDDPGTPMSTYSDSSRAPIGILSMRKLMPESSNALGGQIDNDDVESHMDGIDDHHYDDSSSLPRGMKHLQF